MNMYTRLTVVMYPDSTSYQNCFSDIHKKKTTKDFKFALAIRTLYVKASLIKIFF